MLAKILDKVRENTPLLRAYGAHDDVCLSWRDYEMAPASLEAFGSEISMNAQRVLDLGCGLGGKSIYYAEQGAKFVVGVERSEARSRVAAAFARQCMAETRVQIVIADAACLPFRDGCFDCIISTDTWEHLWAPDLVLQGCARVIRPYGILAISAMPYYSPWGAHAWLWVPLPWLPSLLPRPVLFRLVSWIDLQFAVNERLPQALRLDWTDFEDPGHARKLTVASLTHTLAATSQLALLRFAVIPVGARYGGVVSWISRLLIGFPVLRELLAGMIIVTMYKVPNS